MAEVFGAGLVSSRLVTTIVYRTGLITDADAAARWMSSWPRRAVGWGPLSVARTELALDELIDRHDP